MKTFLALVALAVTLVSLQSTVSYADLLGSPFMPEVDARFDKLEGNTRNSTSNISALKVARAVWNPSLKATDGDSTTTSGTHSLGVALPANAILKDSWLYVVTQPVSAGGVGKLSFQCEDSDNIYPAQYFDNQPATKIISGKQSGVSGTVGASANMTASIAASCNISAKVADVAFTAGKIIVYVSYVVAE